MHCYGLTDVGKVRDLNEDSYATETISDEIVVAVVADGMGGHNAGEVASGCAASEMIRLVKEAAKYFCKYTDKQMTGFLKNAVNKVNKTVYQKSLEAENLYGMGTTLVVCVVYNKKCYIANVGDSRLYKYSGSLKQITKDHSYVAELVELGMLTPEEANDHPNKNVITRAIGTEPMMVPDIFIEKISSGDVFLLCSDGLTNMVTDGDISKVISQNADVENSAAKLIELALENGGLDNITAVLIKSENGGEQEE